jgi:methylated-DNA-[protein]-cysteine S-methyltransferase
MSISIIQSPIGPLGLNWVDGALCGLDLEPTAATTGTTAPSTLLDELAAYFADPAHRFRMPIRLSGTPFRQRVWSALGAIPVGQTRTYGELAAELGTSARAVGGACRANPCPIVVPCHRVVGSNGLGGFAGDTSGRKLAVKRWLLRHEGVKVQA